MHAGNDLEHGRRRAETERGHQLLLASIPESGTPETHGRSRLQLSKCLKCFRSRQQATANDIVAKHARSRPHGLPESRISPADAPRGRATPPSPFPSSTVEAAR